MIFQCTNYQNQLFVYSDIFSALKNDFCQYGGMLKGMQGV